MYNCKIVLTNIVISYNYRLFIAICCEEKYYFYSISCLIPNCFFDKLFFEKYEIKTHSFLTDEIPKDFFEIFL